MEISALKTSLLATSPVDNDEDKPPVISNLTMDIKQGKTLALVGPSGSGKTTMCHLIPRFYDIDSGAHHD